MKVLSSDFKEEVYDHMDYCKLRLPLLVATESEDEKVLKDL